MYIFVYGSEGRQEMKTWPFSAPLVPPESFPYRSFCTVKSDTGFSTVLVWFSPLAIRVTSPIYHVQRCLFLFLGHRLDYLQFCHPTIRCSRERHRERAMFVAYLTLVINLVRLWQTCVKLPLQLPVQRPKGRKRHRYDVSILLALCHFIELTYLPISASKT